MELIKKILKTILPLRAVKAIRNYRFTHARPEYRNLSIQQVFTKIYEDGAWGKANDSAQKFYSGSGAHNDAIAGTYIEAIRTFLSSFERKPDVVDLGCGDCFIASRVRSLCNNYTACDIVESLIKFNREKYKDLDIDFRVLNITKDELPKGDVVFLRQVLQHLSNEQISSALPQITSKYKYLVLTEHVPEAASFVHNLDMPAGPDIRLGIDSGIVLTSPPFNLKCKEQARICEVPEAGGVIRTYLYKLS